MVESSEEALFSSPQPARGFPPHQPLPWKASGSDILRRYSQPAMCQQNLCHPSQNCLLLTSIRGLFTYYISCWRGKADKGGTRGFFNTNIFGYPFFIRINRKRGTPRKNGFFFKRGHYFSRRRNSSVIEFTKQRGFLPFQRGRSCNSRV